MTGQRLSILVALCLALPACSMDWSMAEHDADVSVDADADADNVGADADADADIDAEPDAADADVDDAVGPVADADGDDAADADTDDAVGPDADADADGDVDADADAGGLVLNAAGVATVAGEGRTTGSLRLTELGFEGGGRSCAGSLCLWVGVMP
ncbi:MAG: hypothetical protein HY905_09625 [Deltaproteobacteria bacterium]|nr:hypothetical protein [Deltaproteobacteria bacterium]